MPVGDYVHSKNAGQHHRPITGERPNSRLSRQHAAEQAKVSVPATKLTGFAPPSTTAPDGKIKLEHRAPPPLTGVQQQQQPQQAAQNNEGAPYHRDPFDTDVEGVDDSTIAGTSIIGAEDSQVQEPAYPNAYHYAAAEARWIKRSNENPGYGIGKSEGLGDKALKAAGFDSDETDAEDAQTVSSLHDDDDDDGGANGEETQVLRWQPSQEHHRLAEEPMSTRLENHFWETSKKQYQKSQNLPLNGMTPAKRVLPLPDAWRTGQTAYKNGLLGTTPRGRFSRPQSLLDRLQVSPTRGASGPRPQPGRPGSPENLKQQKGENENMAGLNGADVKIKRRYSIRSATGVFDTTDVENIDDTESFDNHFLSSSRETSKLSSEPPPEDKKKDKDKEKVETAPPQPSKKRQFEPDYPQEVLTKKSFSDLQSEPFDFIPSFTPPEPTPAASPRPPSPKEAQTAAERVSLLMTLSDQERRDYLSTLSIDEWEECGDHLIEQFSTMLIKMKEARHARRRTAALFEAEIKRRHEQVQEQDGDLRKKLADMREGGLGVLRGLTP
ncbi:hypothetical protein VTN00DRAFT_205 [Thermoascus crustaceus]|uniref:uncharacterized protein n=1 Tax=Thermoascus crustaceus TaxID=5088 RepID=UPI0037422ED7